MAPTALPDVIKIPERISHPQDHYGTGEVLNNLQWLPLPCVPVLTPLTVFPNVSRVSLVKRISLYLDSTFHPSPSALPNS